MKIINGQIVLNGKKISGQNIYIVFVGTVSGKEGANIAGEEIAAKYDYVYFNRKTGTFDYMSDKFRGQVEINNIPVIIDDGYFKKIALSSSSQKTQASSETKTASDKPEVTAIVSQDNQGKQTESGKVVSRGKTGVILKSNRNCNPSVPATGGAVNDLSCEGTVAISTVYNPDVEQEAEQVVEELGISGPRSEISDITLYQRLPNRVLENNYENQPITQDEVYVFSNRLQFLFDSNKEEITSTIKEYFTDGDLTIQQQKTRGELELSLLRDYAKFFNRDNSVDVSAEFSYGMIGGWILAEHKNPNIESSVFSDPVIFPGYVLKLYPKGAQDAYKEISQRKSV